MEVKSFDFREEKKNDERCVQVGRIRPVEKKKKLRNDLHVDLGKEKKQYFGKQ